MQTLKFSVLALAVTAALTACNDNNNDEAAERSIHFAAVNAPQTDAEKRNVQVAAEVTLNGETVSTGFKTLMRSGDTYGETFGQLYDATGTPLLSADGSMNISNSNDFASLLPVNDQLFMVSHFENRPGAMYLTKLQQDAASGELSRCRPGIWIFRGERRLGALCR
ncbi:MAG: hypothetical protein R3E95_11580 [Thiolinea sp.]